MTCKLYDLDVNGNEINVLIIEDDKPEKVYSTHCDHYGDKRDHWQRLHSVVLSSPNPKGDSFLAITKLLPVTPHTTWEELCDHFGRSHSYIEDAEFTADIDGKLYVWDNALEQLGSGGSDMIEVTIEITNPYDDGCITSTKLFPITPNTTWQELCDLFMYRDYGYDEMVEFHAEIDGAVYEWTEDSQLSTNLEE